VRIAFDPSVLVAALVEPHPLHARAICWIEAAASGKAKAECSWHAIAEIWTLLTRLPMEPPISPPLAAVAIERLTRHVEPVEVSDDVYRAAIRRCAERGLRAGALYDAIHLVCAEASGVDALVTFDAADFEWLVVEPRPVIIVPPDPPAFVLPSA